MILLFGELSIFYGYKVIQQLRLILYMNYRCFYPNWGLEALQVVFQLNRCKDSQAR